METRLNISGMRCASCAATIERILRKTAGVKSASVNFATEMLAVEHSHEISENDIKEIVRKAGYKAFRAESAEKMEGMMEHEHHAAQSEIWKRFKWAAILSIPLLITMILGVLNISLPINDKLITIVQFILATGTVIAGWNFYHHGFMTVYRNKSANMDTLVALGTGTAYIYSIIIGIQALLGKAAASDL